MAADIAPAELSNQLFRFSVLSLFNTAKDQPEATHAIKDVHYKRVNDKGEVVTDPTKPGRYMVDHTLPDGKREYWAEVTSSYDAASGFKAMAFERRNRDGSTYLENGQPQLVIAFPGNTNTKIDLETSQNIVGGDSGRYFTSRSEFMERTARGMEERRQIAGYSGTPKVLIGAHSIGVNGAIGAAQDLQAHGVTSIQNIYYESVGAGQAVQQYAPLLAAKRAKTDQPTQAQIEQAARDLSDVISVNGSKNMFQGKGGDQANDNAHLGQSWHLNTGTHPINSHYVLTAAQVLQQHVQPLRTPDKDVSALDILNGGRALTGAEMSAATNQAKMFVDMIGGTTAGFNSVAAAPPDEKPNAPRVDFSDVGPAETIPVAAPIVASVPVKSSAMVDAAPQTPPPAVTDPIEIVKNYLKDKGYECGTGSGWTSETNGSFGRCLAEAQLTQIYKESYQARYSKTAHGVDFMPGPASRVAMEKSGMPANVLAALDEMKMFDRMQKNDLYEPPASLEDAKTVVALAQNSPLAFKQAEQQFASANPDAGAVLRPAAVR